MDTTRCVCCDSREHPYDTLSIQIEDIEGVMQEYRLCLECTKTKLTELLRHLLHDAAVEFLKE